EVPRGLVRQGGHARRVGRGEGRGPAGAGGELRPVGERAGGGDVHARRGAGRRAADGRERVGGAGRGDGHGRSPLRWRFGNERRGEAGQPLRVVRFPTPV